MQQLDPLQPLHFIGVGGIGMSALAAILAGRGFRVSGSDPRRTPVLSQLEACGVTVFHRQEAATIESLRRPDLPAAAVVISTAVPESNTELAAARQAGWSVLHRSDLLAALINSQPSVAVAGSHGKTTTSTLIASLLEDLGHDPTAVIGGIVPAFGSNARQGRGRLLVAEADESDGSLVKFRPELGVITNLELDHTDHYPDLDSLIRTVQTFASRSGRLLANRDCPVLRGHFRADHWWSIETSEGVAFAALPLQERGDGTSAEFFENGHSLGSFELPLAGRHNLSNALAAMAVCRLEGIPFSSLRQAVGRLQPPGRRFDCRGTWRQRIVVDDYAHHPSEVEATLAMARLMVESGRSPLPLPPRRLVAIFQPHRFSRTAQFLQGFASALRGADLVLLAPLYAAGEAPIAGISSSRLAEEIRRLAPGLGVEVMEDLDGLAQRLTAVSQPGDLLLAMGAGDINSLWDRLGRLVDQGRPEPLAA